MAVQVMPLLLLLLSFAKVPCSRLSVGGIFVSDEELPPPKKKKLLQSTTREFRAPVRKVARLP